MNIKKTIFLYSAPYLSKQLYHFCLLWFKIINP